jgi:hypothetical protein
MSRDVPLLREECALVLVEVIKDLGTQSESERCAEALMQRLAAFKLVNTPEGVGIWLAVRDHFDGALPAAAWHNNDPLSKKERTRLADVLKENFQSKAVKSDANIKSGNANPNPKFAWIMVLSEMLQRDETLRNSDTSSTKLGFPQLWTDIVDSECAPRTHHRRN